jgi:hypothetical protein
MQNSCISYFVRLRETNFTLMKEDKLGRTSVWASEG